MVVEALEEQIRRLDVPSGGDAIAGLLRLQDAVAAKLTAAVGEFAASEAWAVEGATSVKAWLRHEGRMSSGDAHRLARAAARLCTCPATQEAWLAGTLSGGHVQAVVANVSEATAPLFAEHEPEMVPVLAALDPVDAPAVMREWCLRAEAVIDDAGDGPDQPERSLFHSRLMDCRSVLRGTFDPEAAEVVDTALRLAMTDDAVAEAEAEADGGRVRLPAERRADALVDVCRHFLDHQRGHRGGRHRPHLNVVVDLDAVENRGQGRLIDGTPLDPVTIQRLLCDAAVHRVVTDGRSMVLDYGRATRTISPAMWATLVLRDRHCRAAGCDRRPDMCEAHHVVPWQDGGPTDQHNLVLLCTRHHHLLHKPGWQAKLLPDATVEITTPDGRVLATKPPGRTPPLPLTA